MGRKDFEPTEFVSKAGIGKTIVRCREGENVFMQGDAADAVFYLQSGKIKLTVASARGKEAVIALLKPGSFFGEGCLNGQLRRLATASALTDVSVMRIAKAAMVRLLRTRPAFAAHFMSYLLDRNSRIEEDLVDQLFNSSEKRLARVLLLLANFGKDHTPEPIVPRINQEMLAEMVGTTRSRVSFFMNKFRKLGFIEYDGERPVTINGSLLSVVLHD